MDQSLPLIINIYDGIAQSYTIHLSENVFVFVNVIGLMNAFIQGYQFFSTMLDGSPAFYFLGVSPDVVGQGSMHFGMDMLKAIDALFPLRLCWQPLEMPNVSIDFGIYWEISSKGILTFEILRKGSSSHTGMEMTTFIKSKQ